MPHVLVFTSRFAERFGKVAVTSRANGASCRGLTLSGMPNGDQMHQRSEPNIQARSIHDAHHGGACQLRWDAPLVAVTLRVMNSTGQTTKIEIGRRN